MNYSFEKGNNKTNFLDQNVNQENARLSNTKAHKF